MHPFDPPEDREETKEPSSHHGQTISDIGDTLRLDHTIGCPASRFGQADTLEGDLGDDTVIQDPAGSDPISQMSVEQWLESLRRTDRTFYNMMAMEVWSIAKSMDMLIPGFWSKFMENRQLAVQNFVVKRRTDKPTGLRLEDLGHPDDISNSPIDDENS